MTLTPSGATTGPARASIRDTVGVVAGVMAPTLAKGVIIRRKAVVRLAERLDLDGRAVRRLQRLRSRYGSGPLVLRIPLRSQVVLLAPEHVHRVLERSPEPFSPASSEKRAALSHFQPKGVLVSRGPERADRRRFNEAVLDTEHPVHRCAARFVEVVDEEAGRLRQQVEPGGTLSWDDFSATWFRVVRRVVLGDHARDDEELTALLDSLRSDANWAFARPKRTERRDQLLDRLGHHLDRAEPGSLAHLMAATPTGADTAPRQQVPQWLFAYDPAGMTTFRSLALLASHPAPLAEAQAEVGRRQGEAPELSFLRACVLESLRLWPTTPALLRQTTAPTLWGGGTLPAGTGVFIFTNYFHRDDQRLPYAHTFTPSLWQQDRTTDDWPLVPFSGGPVMCPGRNLVLLTTSSMLAALLAAGELRLLRPARLDPAKPLPGTLDPYSLAFGWG